MTNLIELTRVNKVYGERAAQPALQDVNLNVAFGEFVAVMGPSGSGKSTLLNLIAGLDRATSGTVRVGDQTLGTMGEGQLAKFRRTHVGVIFQFFHLLNNLTVLENMLVPAELARMERKEARIRADQLLRDLGIAGKTDVYPAELSGGQQQRVAIARALINRPPLLLADEPTGALDSRSGDGIMELLETINATGQTVVLVTHDAKLAARHARRIVSVRDGRITDDTTLAPASAAAALISFTAHEAHR